MKCVDLFAGAGGLSEGLRQAGFHCACANELRPEHAATYALNHPKARLLACDIRATDPAEIRRSLRLERGEIDLVAGGPPCQGFSINAPIRRSDDARNHLFKEFLRFVREFSPRAVLIENVPGLVSFEGGATLQAMLESLSGLGYSADVRILSAAHFGVPQTRWRAFVIGLRSGSPVFPEPTHRTEGLRINFATTFAGRSLVVNGAGQKPFTRLREALDDLPPLRNGESPSGRLAHVAPPRGAFQKAVRGRAVVNHCCSRLGAVNLERLKLIPQGGNWTSLPHEMLPAGMKRARTSDHTMRYGRPRLDGLACTMLTKCDPHWGAYFHPTQDRVFSVREAARIQSFPDDFVFTGVLAHQYEQVGNAVPPMLARAVGLAVAAALNGDCETQGREAAHGGNNL